jgi:CheY-like chemotaxis protein
MEVPTQPSARLVLLVDPDPATREGLRPLVAELGLEIVQARQSIAALEILQRLPHKFRLAIVTVEMPGLSGAVLVETLRLFRPTLPTVCLIGADRAPVPVGSLGNCLEKPIRPEELRAQVRDALAGDGGPMLSTPADRVAVARAKATFAVSGSLLDAARELARGTPSEPASGW